MSIKEFVGELKSESYKNLAEALLDRYNIDKEQDMYCYDLEAGAYHNGMFFSIGIVLEIIKKVDEDFD